MYFFFRHEFQLKNVFYSCALPSVRFMFVVMRIYRKKKKKTGFLHFRIQFCILTFFVLFYYFPSHRLRVIIIHSRYYSGKWEITKKKKKSLSIRNENVHKIFHTAFDNESFFLFCLFLCIFRSFIVIICVPNKLLFLRVNGKRWFFLFFTEQTIVVIINQILWKLFFFAFRIFKY